MSERRPLLESRPSSTLSASQVDTHAVTTHETASALRKGSLAVAILLLLFLTTCNISMLTTIQSPIAAELDVTTGVSWFASAFLIASASVTPLAGKLCEVFTDRWYLLGSVFLETIGLLVSARASSTTAFLAGRVIHGGGVAALAPIAIVLVRQHAIERHHALLFGTINCAYTAGLASGAIIAGALEPVVGWRAIFWLQCLPTLLLGIMAFAAIPHSQPLVAQDAKRRTTVNRLSQLDCFGMVTMTSSVVLMLYSISAPQPTLLPLILSLVSLTLFVAVETYWATEPIIPPAVLRSRGVMLTGVATIGGMSARWAVLFHMPTYAIAVRQWSASRAGSLLIPTNLGFALGGVFVGWLHIRRSQSYYVSTLTALGLFAVSECCMSSLVAPRSSLWMLMLALFVNGFLMGAVLIYTLTHVLFVTDPVHSIVVIPVITTFRVLSGAFGSAIAGNIFTRALQTSLHQNFASAGLHDKDALIAQLLGRPMLVQSLSGQEHTVAVTSYSTSLSTLYIASTAIVVLTLLVQAGTGWSAPAQPRRLSASSEG